MDIRAINKRRILILIFFVFTAWVYADDFFEQNLTDKNRYSGLVYSENGVYLKIKDGIVILEGYSSNYLSFTIKKEDIIFKDNGYAYIYPKIRNEVSETSIIYGSRFLFFANDENPSFVINEIGEVEPRRYIGFRTGSTIRNKKDETSTRKYMDTYIQSIGCTTFLEDDEILYDTSTLQRYLTVLYAHEIQDFFHDLKENEKGFSEIYTAFNENFHPWVEGVEGPGIGEYLVITFTQAYDDIVVLNGFVDRYRKNLYKANNRVKTAIIRSDDKGEPFEFEYEFEDVVRFEEIHLPRKAKRIIFEIKEVYPGEKWDDTCVSAILTREPDPYKKYPFVPIDYGTKK